MDRDEAQQPTDAQPVDQADAAPSDSPQEAESSFFNRMIRGLAGVVGGGRDPEPSEPAAEQETPPAPTPDAASQQPVDATQTPEFRAAVQAAKDRELVRERREIATTQAEQGNLQPIRDLAERGDQWALRQLEKNGDTWALGEITAKQLREQQARENDPVPVLATSFDQAILWPVLGALPKEEEDRIVGPNGIQGFDGRQKAITEAVASLKRHAAEEALTKALDDEAYARKLVGESSALRQVLLTHPVLAKQLRAMFRGEIDEPDLAPGYGPGRGGQRESDVMNQMIRDLAQGAEVRGPRERAAGAGARNGRAVNLDVLDDDD